MSLFLVSLLFWLVLGLCLLLLCCHLCSSCDCCTLQRRDGSRVNFSYRKTLNAVLGKDWSDQELPELVRLQQLVRVLNLVLITSV